MMQNDPYLQRMKAKSKAPQKLQAPVPEDSAFDTFGLLDGPEEMVQDNFEMPNNDPDRVIDDLNEFMQAANIQKITGQEYAVVTEKLMRTLLRGHRAPSITWGPFRVYLEGVKEKLDHIENLSVESYAKFTNERKRSLK